MGTNIRNFKSWQKVNEGDLWSDWVSGLTAAVTGKEAAPAKAAEPAKKAEDDKAAETKTEATPAKSTKDATDSEKVVNKKAINNKPYSEKLASISKKLGLSPEESTVLPDSSLFINLDLSVPKNVKLYADICQAWIGIRKPMVAQIQNPITGRDFAEAAAHVYQRTGVYVPPQLVLAQATLEGGFAKQANKPIDTKNLFNVGNTDDGSIKSFNDKGESVKPKSNEATWKGGIIAYFNLLANRYIIPGKKTADDLVLGEFVNKDGNRYATSREYEEGLLKLIDEINSKVIA